MCGTHTAICPGATLDYTDERGAWTQAGVDAPLAQWHEITQRHSPYLLLNPQTHTHFVVFSLGRLLDIGGKNAHHPPGFVPKGYGSNPVCH